MLRQAVVPDHVRYREVFHSDDPILVCEPPAELVEKISSLILNLDVKLRKPHPCLESPPTAFHSSAESSLPTLEAPLSLDQISRVIDPCSVRKGCETLQAHVYSHFAGGVWMSPVRGGFLGRECGVPLAGRVHLNGQSLDLPLD